jgi:hypothetical protein
MCDAVLVPAAHVRARVRTDDPGVTLIVIQAGAYNCVIGNHVPIVAYSLRARKAVR